MPKAPEPEEIIIGDEDGADGTVNLGVLADLVDEAESQTTELQPEKVEPAEQ